MATLNPRNVLFGVPDFYDLNGLRHEELEVIQSALISFKHNDLQDAETFKNERRICVDLYNAIDSEIIKLKEKELCQQRSQS